MVCLVISSSCPDLSGSGSFQNEKVFTLIKMLKQVQHDGLDYLLLPKKKDTMAMAIIPKAPIIIESILENLDHGNQGHESPKKIQDGCWIIFFETRIID